MVYGINLQALRTKSVVESDGPISRKKLFTTYFFFSKTWPIHTRLMQLTPRFV